MRLIAIASLLLSLSAVACPDLSGSYKVCKDQDGNITSTDLVITQRVENGVTILTSEETVPDTGARESDETRLDGVEKIEVEEAEGGKTTTKITMSCDSEGMKSNVSIDAKYGEESFQMSFTGKTVKEGNALKTIITSAESGETFSSVCE